MGKAYFCQNYSLQTSIKKTIFIKKDNFVLLKNYNLIEEDQTKILGQEFYEAMGGLFNSYVAQPKQAITPR